MYQQLHSWQNLVQAYRSASKGKRGHPNVAAFEHHLEENLIELQRDLRQFSYQPERYTSFYIHEPKRRLISAAPFRDRVVHHALCQLIEPIFERSFIFDSYANRVGKGTHRALDRCQQFARRYGYVLPCDIKQFFPSIDHAVLRQMLERKLKDEGVLWLIDQILASGVGVLAEEYQMVYFAGDDLFAVMRPRGLPIGNLTSQFWGNVYLNAFDHFVQRELGVCGYVRYVDDFLLFGNDKKQLWRCLTRVQQRLAEIRLTIHGGTNPRPVQEGIPFLGFVVFPEKRRIKQHKVVYFCRRFRANCAAYEKGLLGFEQLSASVQGWVNHARYGNSVGLRKYIFNRRIKKQSCPSILGYHNEVGL